MNAVAAYSRESATSSKWKSVFPGSRIAPADLAPTDRRPWMSDAENATPAEEQESHSSFWPDETVDMFAALVVVSAVVLACLWYVTGS